MTTTLTHTNIQPKPMKRKGQVITPANHDGTFNAEVVPGVSIRIFGVFTNRHVPVIFNKTFKIGDEVEHGSYNLIYTGKVIAIGPNSVTVERSDIGNKPMRMDLCAFIGRNWDFDAAKITRHNAEESQCI